MPWQRVLHRQAKDRQDPVSRFPFSGVTEWGALKSLRRPAWSCGDGKERKMNQNVMERIDDMMDQLHELRGHL